MAGETTAPVVMIHAFKQCQLSRATPRFRGSPHETEKSYVRRYAPTTESVRSVEYLC
jgi:hypothetical protein